MRGGLGRIRGGVEGVCVRERVRGGLGGVGWSNRGLEPGGREGVRGGRVGLGGGGEGGQWGVIGRGVEGITRGDSGG